MTPLAIRCIVGMTILLLAAGLGSHLLRKRLSASQRHVIWTAAMVLSLLLPVLLQWTPPATTLVARGGVEVQRILITVTPDPLPAPTNWPRAIWLGGMAAMALWTVAGYLRASKLLASSREFATVDGVAVRTAAELKMPAVALGPAILLPESAAEWPAERLDVVLTHELAHVRRWDLLWRLAGSAVCCVYWFHPLAWWAAAQQRRESEMSCDDQVLNHGCPN
ncbi:MAG: M56 family metallopeptidase [Acidobacteria bacterium]|nr:M56 family metallopeptidase [Acidobacteriota bacterium]